MDGNAKDLLDVVKREKVGLKLALLLFIHKRGSRKLLHSAR